MNRIRQLREARGMSVAELAERVGTSQPQITRLEMGRRKLTVDWMRRIATALECDVTDLLARPTASEFREEVEPYSGPVPGGIGSLSARSLALFTIKSDSVSQAGVVAGDTILIDMSQNAVDGVKTGDIVVAQIYDNDDLMKATTVVRQFLAPHLLVTNKPGTNIAFNMDTDLFQARIKGVMVKPTGDDGDYH